MIFGVILLPQHPEIRLKIEELFPDPTPKSSCFWAAFVRFFGLFYERFCELLRISSRIFSLFRAVSSPKLVVSGVVFRLKFVFLGF